MLRNLLWALVVVVVLIGPALARPFTVDDLLHLESLGKAAVDPSGRWLVFDRRAPYDSAPRFDYDGRPEVILGRLMVVDLAHSGAARPLIEADPDTGYTPGPFSPSGRAILVYRHKGETWEAGVIDLMTGKARWLSQVGDISDFGRAAQWRSDTELVMSALPRGTLPYDVREGRRAMTRLPVLWDRAVWNKGVTMIVIGVGRYRDANPAPPSKQLIDINLVTGAVTALAEGPFTDLELSQDGRYVAALAWADPERAVTDSVVRLGDPDRRRDLVLIDLATGAVRHPLPGRDVVWSLLSWSPAKPTAHAGLFPRAGHSVVHRVVRAHRGEWRRRAGPQRSTHPPRDRLDAHEQPRDRARGLARRRARYPGEVRCGVARGAGGLVSVGRRGRGQSHPRRG